MGPVWIGIALARGAAELVASIAELPEEALMILRLPLEGFVGKWSRKLRDWVVALAKSWVDGEAATLEGKL